MTLDLATVQEWRSEAQATLTAPGNQWPFAIGLAERIVALADALLERMSASEGGA